jgi:hypothetical protein
MSKCYVGVQAAFSPEGDIRPLRIEWEDGRIFDIDRVTTVQRAASLRSGGSGIRYRCQVGGRWIYLFLEQQRWFLERAEG